MLKLYKRVDGKLLYREAWIEGAEIIEHFGAVGDKGATRRHPHPGGGITGADAVHRVLESAIADGFAEIDIEDHATLLIEYKIGELGSSPADLPKRHRLEERMGETLGWTGLGHCDGGSIGMGTMEACCLVVDFDIAKKVIEADLRGTEFADYSRIFDEGSDETDSSPQTNGGLAHPYESYFYNFADWGDAPAPTLLKQHYPPGSAREQIFLHYHDLHPERPDYLVEYLDSRLKNGIYDETDFVECFAKTDAGFALPPKGASHKKLEKIRENLERQLKEFEQLPEDTSDQSQSASWRYRRGEYDQIIADFASLRTTVKPVGILGGDDERNLWGHWLLVIEIHFDRQKPERAIALLDEYERARLAVHLSPTPSYDVQLKSVGYLAQIDLATARRRVRFWWDNTKVRSFDDLLKTHPDFRDLFVG